LFTIIKMKTRIHVVQKQASKDLFSHLKNGSILGPSHHWKCFRSHQNFL